MRKLYLFILIIICSGFIQAQDLSSEINSLEKDFQSFKYARVLEKGEFLLSDSYTSKLDSLQIYQYMLSSAYALNDTAQARLIIEDILSCEPKFALDPRQTSPKIIELFNSYKRQIDHSAVVKADSGSAVQQPDYKIPQSLPLHSFLASAALPGSGHLIEGFKKKGYIYTTASILWLSGTIYAAIKTKEYRDKYMEAGGDAEYNKLYSNYDTAYKLQNILLIGYGLWSLYGLYDLQSEHNISFNLTADQQNVAINLTVRF